MKVTKQQLFEHYLEAGMHEVYAAMAADEHFYRPFRYFFITANSDALETLYKSFSWVESSMGYPFWRAIYEELRYAGK